MATRIPTTARTRMKLLLGLTVLLISSIAVESAGSSSAVFVLPRSNRRAPLTTLDIRGGGTTATEASTSNNNDMLQGLKSSLASALAAGCSKTLLAPFDTLKTVQQHHRVGAGTALSFWEAVQLVMARPRGFLEFYVRIMENDVLRCVA